MRIATELVRQADRNHELVDCGFQNRQQPIEVGIMELNFSKSSKVVPALPPATGSADRNGVIVDTKGFVGVAFLVHFGTIAAGAVTSIKLEGGSQSDLSDAADLSGTTQTVADDDDDKAFVIDVSHPKHRYVRLVVDKDASNDTTESAFCLLYNGKDEPVTQPSDVSDAFVHAPSAA